MNKHLNKDRSKDLYRALLLLKTEEEAEKFMDDLCTKNELLAMEQRFQLALLLNQGLKYNEILAQTDASSATISRVNRSLQYGAEGYELVFRRMKEDGKE